MSIFESHPEVLPRVMDDALRMTRPQKQGIFEQNPGSPVCGDKAQLGKARCLSPRQAGMMMLVDDLMHFGMKSPLALRIAERFMIAVREYPDAPQLTMTVIQSGAISIQPTDGLNFDSGFINGGLVSFTMMIDVRNLAARVDTALEKAGQRRAVANV
ncbi:hypothetical protein [uncultured Parasphingopyxis sp.]|uniref:hypothetical protein n=1 Tax=uncultured Parasphingopyxis sp. TaxID=1547918 RepID=UPI00262A43F6|nr:hypothetical protein [uncultured Parasphingopyxis sp.]